MTRAEAQHILISPMIDRAHRLQVVMAMRHRMTLPTWWKLLAEIWTNVDNTEDLWPEIRPVLTEPERWAGRRVAWGNGADEFMCEASLIRRGHYRVWRGCDADTVEGPSWTGSRGTAEKFAQWILPVEYPVVVMGYVHPDHVMFYTNRRGEYEFACLPEHVHVWTMIDLPQRSQSSVAMSALRLAVHNEQRRIGRDTARSVFGPRHDTLRRCADMAAMTLNGLGCHDIREKYWDQLRRDLGKNGMYTSEWRAETAPVPEPDSSGVARPEAGA